MANVPSLKVGFVFDDTLDSNDGVAQYVKTLGGWLSGQGHSVSYLVGQTKLDSWQGGRVYSLAKNVSVRFNGNRLSIPLPASRKKIDEVLKEERFDILHVMTPYSPFLAQKIIMGAKAPAVVVGTFHIFPSGWLSRSGSRLLRLAYWRSLPRFSRIVSVSRPAARFAKQAYGIDSDVIPNPVETARFRLPSKSNSGANSHRIVFLGRLVKRKGCRQLIEAFSLVHNEYPASELVIAGDGPQRRELENLAREKGLSEKITFLGYIKEEDKPRLLHSAAVACFPSLYGEAFGIVLIEAMAAGSGPILAGDNPGYRSVLGDQSQLLVNPSDTEAFAGRLKTMLADAGMRRRIMDWQKKTVGQYDVSEVGKQVLDMYRTEIARQTKKSHNKHHE
ncbi:MAG TPA: glycosyltransferase family 4 protein [Candidatus Saccharimonadales bacterium]|nr:glycosyltransferase family 4 protein [Candidatus Saccharimonadales bacterium]